MLQKNETGAGEVAQWVRPLAAMPDNLSLLLQTHMEEGENQLPCWWCVCVGGQLEKTRRFITKLLPSHMVGLQLSPTSVVYLFLLLSVLF